MKLGDLTADKWEIKDKKEDIVEDEEKDTSGEKETEEVKATKEK